jgi:hypothetical protein
LARPEWYARIVEFFTTQQLWDEWTKEDSKYFAVIGHGLFRRETHELLRRFVLELEVSSILTACHDSVCGGHFSSQLTGQKNS